MRDITNEQAAYIAGFLEGEGSFFISEQHHQPVISTGQKELRILRYIESLTKVGTISYRPKLKAYYWRISNKEELISLIERILPFFVGKRSAKRASCVLEMSKLRRQRSINQYRMASSRNLFQRTRVYADWTKTRRKVEA